MLYNVYNLRTKLKSKEKEDANEVIENDETKIKKLNKNSFGLSFLS